MGPSLFQQLKMLTTVIVLVVLFFAWLALAGLGLALWVGPLLAGLLMFLLLMSGSKTLMFGIGMVLAFIGAHTGLHQPWYIAALLACPVIPLFVLASIWWCAADLVKSLFKKKEQS